MDRREGGKDTGAHGGEQCKEHQGLHVMGTRAGGTQGTEAGREGECGGSGCRGDQGHGCRGDPTDWIKGGQGHVEGMDAGGIKGMDAGGVDAGDNQGNGYKGDREMQREWMQGTLRGQMQWEGMQGDRSLTCRHAAVVQAQKHLRLPGKSRINNSAHQVM